MSRWFPIAALMALLALPAAAREGPVGPGPQGGAPSLSLERFLAGARVAKPAVHRSLAIFPVIPSATAEIPRHLSLDAAFQAGVLKVAEVSDSGSVNQIQVENQGKTPVFMMAGEILTGAKQDRVLQDDLWLPAGSGPVAVACYCVEQGRWSYSAEDRDFKARPVVSNTAVRQAARASNDQGAVWSAVAETQSSVGYGGSTALGATYEAPKVRDDLQGYLSAMKGLLKENPTATGFVVAVNGRILAADLFGSRQDAESLWPKLLPSYALEAARAPDAVKPGVTSDQALAFLRRGGAARVVSRATPGEGTLVSLEGGDVVGSALLLGRAVAHVELFPRVEGGEPKPVPIQRQYGP